MFDKVMNTPLVYTCMIIRFTYSNCFIYFFTIMLLIVIEAEREAPEM